jgi:hypothetical protein
VGCVVVLGVGFWHWLDSTLALAYSDVRLQVDGLEEGRFEGRAHHAGRQALQFWTELTGEFDLLAGPEPSAAVGMRWKLSTFELGSENELDQGSVAGGPRMAGRYRTEGVLHGPAAFAHLIRVSIEARLHRLVLPA